MQQIDLSQVRLNGTLIGNIATSANGSGTKYFKETFVEVGMNDKIYKIPVSGFGTIAETAESMMNQRVLVGANVALELSQDGSKVYPNISVDSLQLGGKEDGSSFAQTGQVAKIEEVGKLKKLHLSITRETWNRTKKAREIVDRELQIAFFGDSMKQLDGLSRGMTVLVEGNLRSSGEKNYLDFIGKEVTVLGEEETLDTDGL